MCGDALCICLDSYVLISLLPLAISHIGLVTITALERVEAIGVWTVISSIIIITSHTS